MDTPHEIRSPSASPTPHRSGKLCALLVAANVLLVAPAAVAQSNTSPAY